MSAALGVPTPADDFSVGEGAGVADGACVVVNVGVAVAVAAGALAPTAGRAGPGPDDSIRLPTTSARITRAAAARIPRGSAARDVPLAGGASGRCAEWLAIFHPSSRASVRVLLITEPPTSLERG